LGGTTHDLAEQAVLFLALDQHGQGLVHLGTDHAPLDGAAGGLVLNLCLAHLGGPYFVFVSPSTILVRAISRRTRRNWWGWLNCPEPFCMRRLNCSLRNSSRWA